MKQVFMQALKKMKTVLPATAFGRPYTQVIYAVGDWIEITDGYFWCKTHNTHKLCGQYDKEAINKYITCKVDQPLYKQADCVWPKTEDLLTGNEEHLFKVNADFLGKALAILTADSVDKSIYVSRDKNGSIVLKHEDGNMGLVAPTA